MYTISASLDKIGKKLIDICGKLLPYRDGGSFSLSSKMQCEGFLRIFANVSYDQISPEILQRIVSLLSPSRISPNYIIISVLDFFRNHIDVLHEKLIIHYLLLLQQQQQQQQIKQIQMKD